MCTNPTEIPHYKNDTRELNLHAVSSNKFLFFFIKKKVFVNLIQILVMVQPVMIDFKKIFKYLIQKGYHNFSYETFNNIN